MPEPIFPETREVADAVEAFIESEHTDARRYSNRTPLDSSGCYSLHRLAGRIYADGWAQGSITGHDQRRRFMRRELDVHRDQLEKTLPIALDLHQYVEPIPDEHPGGCSCDIDLADGGIETWRTHMTAVLLKIVLP